MTINEIRSKKRETEKAIADLLIKFQRDTTCEISDVRMTMSETFPGNKEISSCEIVSRV